MTTLTIEQIRDVIRAELALAIGKSIAPRRTRRKRVQADKEWISATAADARFGWKNGTASDLFLAGKIIGRDIRRPGALRPRYSVSVASCRAWMGDK